LADEPALTLLSLGADPLLFLPEFDLGEFRDEVFCEVRMTFAAQLVSLPQYLQAWKLSLPDARIFELQGLLTDLERDLSESEGERRRFVSERLAIDDAMAKEREEMLRKDQAGLDLAVQNQRLTKGLEAAKMDVVGMTSAMERFRAEREAEVSAFNSQFMVAVSAHEAGIAAMAAQHAREIALRVEKQIELEAAVAAEITESARLRSAIERLREVHHSQLQLLEQETTFKLADRDEQIQVLVHTVEQIKNSASWHITRPFRWLRDAIYGRR